MQQFYVNWQSFRCLPYTVRLAIDISLLTAILTMARIERLEKIYCVFAGAASFLLVDATVPMGLLRRHVEAVCGTTASLPPWRLG